MYKTFPPHSLTLAAKLTDPVLRYLGLFNKLQNQEMTVAFLKLFNLGKL